MSPTTNSKKRTAADAGLPDDNGAAVSNEDTTPCCWICLEEGLDDSGAPLVRDCSCRGSSGFAHLPCIIQYAESTLRNAQERGGAVQCSDICRGFLTCPNCNQEYQNNVKYEMTRALVACVEREVTGTGHGQELLHATALTERLFQLDGNKEGDKAEGDEIYGKLLALMDKMKDCDDISESFKAIELDIYASMCNFDFTVGTDDSLKRAEANIAKVRDICSAAGGDQMHLLTYLDAMMKDIESKLSGKDLQCEHVKDLNFSRQHYIDAVETLGQSDPTTIRSGVDLAAALYREDCTIEATRLLLKLVKIGRQVHGPDHNCTANVVLALTKVEERRVIVKSQKRWFKALRYEDDGSDCVLEGLLPESADDPKVEESGAIPILPGKGAAVIPSTDILPFPGTPVICHGLRLRGSSHLNGKIGDVRSLDVDGGKCLVHFEEEGLEPTVIKIGNLRVLFDLPEES
eukprot:scaffold4492_cov138-Skeletonema_marinoi.AAC.3